MQWQVLSVVMTYVSASSKSSSYIHLHGKCDRLCENRPYLCLKHLFENFYLKSTDFVHARPLLFSRTGLGNLLNKIQFTFKVFPCLILDLFKRFFEDMYQIWPSITRGG